MKNDQNIIKEILGEHNAVQCQICFEYHKALNLHLMYRHKIKAAEYKERFPDNALFAENVKQQMKDSSFMKTQKGVSFEEKFGIKKANILKKRLSELATSRLTGCTRTEEYKQKMRDAWDKKRVEWSESIRMHANTPERKLSQSIAQKERIAKNGLYFAWGKETDIEKFGRICLESSGYKVKKQKRSHKQILGSYRYYDLYVPELNLLIETDAEWWHNRLNKFEIDISKTYAAVNDGYSFLRISNKIFKKLNHTEIDMFMKLINLDHYDKLQYSWDILGTRIISV